MKEYISQLGGRYTYIDDIANLQELALSMTSIFNDCGNFIISGCELKGTELTPGYVFLNKKIRYCEGLSVIKKTDASFVYICEQNSYENVAYEEAGDKIGRIVYGCYASEALPGKNELVAGGINKHPQVITIYKGRDSHLTPRLINSFFGKYSILSENANPDGQFVKNSISLDGSLNLTGSVFSKESVQVLRNGSEALLSVDSHGSVVLRNATLNGGKYDIRITKTGSIELYNGVTKFANFSIDESEFKNTVKSNRITTGSVAMSENNLYNTFNASDFGSVDINMIGYHDGTNYFRTTNIGDGRGNIVLSVNGKGKSVDINGAVSVHSKIPVSLTLYAKHGKYDAHLSNYMVWKDSENTDIAILGYASESDNSFYINNSIGSITIASDCNIKGTLSVNGTDIKDTFVNNRTYADDMKLKANADDVYTKEAADKTFLKLSGEFTALVKHIGGDEKAAKKKLRDQIEAVYSGDMKNYTHNARLMKDMVFYNISDTPLKDPQQEFERQEVIRARREEILKNIGASQAWVSEDSGDRECQLGKNVQSTNKVQARKLGHAVIVQGLVSVRDFGKGHVVFTLPEGIPAPKNIVYFETIQSYREPTGFQTSELRVVKLFLALGGSHGRQCVIESMNGKPTTISTSIFFEYFT